MRSEKELRASWVAVTVTKAEAEFLNATPQTFNFTRTANGTWWHRGADLTIGSERLTELEQLGIVRLEYHMAAE